MSNTQFAIDAVRRLEVLEKENAALRAQLKEYQENGDRLLAVADSYKEQLAAEKEARENAERFRQRMCDKHSKSLPIEGCPYCEQAARERAEGEIKNYKAALRFEQLENDKATAKLAAAESRQQEAVAEALKMAARECDGTAGLWQSGPDRGWPKHRQAYEIRNAILALSPTDAAKEKGKNNGNV